MKLKVLSKGVIDGANQENIQEEINGVWTAAHETGEVGAVDVYAIYHNYEDGDQNGKYTLTIAVEDAQGSFELDTNAKRVKLPDVSNLNELNNLWESVWNDNALEGGINRAFDVDFELHRTDGTISVVLSVD